MDRYHGTTVGDPVMIATRRALLGGLTALPLVGALPARAQEDRARQADAALDAEFARQE